MTPQEFFQEVDRSMNMPYPGDPILSAAAQKELGLVLSKSRAFALAFAHVVPSYLKILGYGRYDNLNKEMCCWLGYDTSLDIPTIPGTEDPSFRRPGRV